MELLPEMLSTVANLQDVNNLNDDTFQHVLDSVVSHVCKSPVDVNNETKHDPKQIESKRAFANLICLFVEAARHDLEEKSMESFLSNSQINSLRAKKICDAYSSNKKILQSQLELVGHNPPHIVDVAWRLDYCVKVDTCNSVGVPLYHIRFSTKEHESNESVTFTCTIQQLQELVSKLKDAVRHLDKLTNV